jgi:hypothetical protein
MYGAAKVGKTTAAIQFPKPYLIDTEHGAENNKYTELLNKQGGVIFQTCDYDDMITEIKSLINEQHDYKTLIIDPLTTIYASVLDMETLKAERTKSAAFGRAYVETNKKMKRLNNLLLQLDMNVIITSHAKTEYSEDMVKLGETFDCYKKMDYLFDLIIQIKKERKAEIRTATIIGSRLEGFKENDCFEFSYAEIQKRYNSEIMEKSATPKNFATPNQINELKNLVSLLKIDEITQHKWLEKAQASSYDDLTEEKANVLIEFLLTKIEKAKETKHE